MYHCTGDPFRDRGATLRLGGEGEGTISASILGGGTRHFVLLTLYNFKNIGRHVPPPPHPYSAVPAILCKHTTCSKYVCICNSLCSQVTHHAVHYFHRTPNEVPQYEINTLHLHKCVPNNLPLLLRMYGHVERFSELLLNAALLLPARYNGRTVVELQCSIHSCNKLGKSKGRGFKDGEAFLCRK